LLAGRDWRGPAVPVMPLDRVGTYGRDTFGAYPLIDEVSSHLSA
jgi:hypothetical protein